MTAAKKAKPTKRNITDVVLSVYEDAREKHAEITLYPAPTLWAGGEGDAFVAGIDEQTALAAQHLLSGLLARLILDMQTELELERVLHGCMRPAWYAANKHDPDRRRRLRSGEHLTADEYPTTDGLADFCGATGPDDGIGVPGEVWGFTVGVTVPRQRLAHWKRRISQTLDQLVADVPQ